MSEEALAQRWNDLTTFVTEEVRQKWWAKILAAHKNRRFSGINHLERMFNEFDKHKDCLKDRYAFAFAIFFKNIVYDTRKSNNPEQSAALLRQFSQETTFDQENRVAELIVESGKGSSDVNLQEGAVGEDDLHYLIDFDLAFLGDSPEAFVDHEQAMRSEHPYLSDMEYAMKRLKTFRFFIQIPNIYATKALRDQYEAKARVNIASEIAILQSGKREYDFIDLTSAC